MEDMRNVDRQEQVIKKNTRSSSGTQHVEASFDQARSAAKIS